MTEQRRRGRPKGSTRYAAEDAAIIRRVADAMVGDKKLNRTAAIREVTGRVTDETLFHRLREKMKPLEPHLAAASARAEEIRRASSSPVRMVKIETLLAKAFVPSPEMRAVHDSLAKVMERLSGAVESPGMQAAMRATAAVAKSMNEILESPGAQQAARVVRDMAKYMDGITASPRFQQASRAVSEALEYSNAARGVNWKELEYHQVLLRSWELQRR